MIKTSIEKLADPIGFDIANSDDLTQAALLNGLGRGFKNLQDHDLSLQMCYVSDKLDKNNMEWLKMLVDLLEL